MADLTFEKYANAPVDVVFGVFSDIARAADRVSGIVNIEMLTDGPVGVGTRFRETRIMFKREAVEEMEFTEFEPGKRFTLSADSCGSHFDSVHEFEADGEGTRIRFEMHVKATTFLAKLMMPLGWLMKGTMRKAIEADFDELIAHCESSDRAAPPAAEASAAG